MRADIGGKRACKIGAVVLGLIMGTILEIMMVVFSYLWFSLKAPYHCCQFIRKDLNPVWQIGICRTEQNRNLDKVFLCIKNIQ